MSDAQLFMSMVLAGIVLGPLTVLAYERWRNR